MKAEMESAKQDYKEFANAIAEEKKRIRNENLIKLGESVCRYFGEDITADRFEEILKKGTRLLRTNRKYKNLSFTFDEWQRIEKHSAECKLKTATYIKQMALNGKNISINMREYHDVI